jgi:PilZ domain
MDDRRNHARFHLWLPARIEGAGEDSQLAVGHDVSQGGALLVTAAELEVGEIVTVVVSIPLEDGPELSLEASVLRCEPNAEDPNGLWPYQVALQFREDVPELEKLLRKHSEVLQGMTDTSEQNS